MSQEKLKNLLNYSTSLSSSSAATPPTTTNNTTSTTASKLDASIINHLLGPSDADLLKESMTAIHSPSLPLSQKRIALENFESLVEQIDNANNLGVLGLWRPLVGLLDHKDPSIVAGAAGIIAVAVQNNPAAQAAVLDTDALEKLLRLWTRSSSSSSSSSDAHSTTVGDGTLVSEETETGAEESGVLEVRKKALFGITATLRNNPAGRSHFARIGGWSSVSSFVSSVSSSKTGDLSMLKRLVFYLRTLILEHPDDAPSTTLLASTIQEDQKSSTGTREVGEREVIESTLSRCIAQLGDEKVLDDEDVTEKIMMLVHASLSHDPSLLSSRDKMTLRELLSPIEERYGDGMCDFSGIRELLDR